MGCASLALLTGCAGSAHQSNFSLSSTYYLDHAAGNYAPPGPPNDPWGPYINIAANRFDVPAMWIRQVMRVESGGHEYSGGQLIVSGAGAMGLMQLEPETYQEMAERYGLGPDPFNPLDNIQAGAAYIHQMYEVYGSPGFLAAYNAGPGRLDHYINHGETLPYETQNYVAMIAPNIQGYYPQHRSEADQLALNTQPQGVDGGLLPPGFTPEAVSAEEVAEAAPVPYTALAVPPPVAPPVRAMQVASAAPDDSSALFNSSALPAPPPAPPARSFAMVQPAMADTPPPPPPPSHYASGHHGWAIQVGAFNNAANARAALGMAELSAVQVLSNGRPVVVSVSYGGRTKYRARVEGLARADAEDACSRLSGGPTGCVVLPPEAQS